MTVNNSFIKRPITHDYTDLSSSLGVSDKDLCTNSQTVFTGKFPSATQATGDENASYSPPGSGIAGMDIQGFRNENSSQTNAYSHYSNYSYSKQTRAKSVKAYRVGSNSSNWFKSYLDNCTHNCFAKCSLSDSQPLTYCTPQGPMFDLTKITEWFTANTLTLYKFND